MFEKLLNAIGYTPIKKVETRINNLVNTFKRSFSAASTGNLYASWATSSYSGDQELKTDLSSIRARSRDLENNNPYAKKVFGTVVRKVVGPNGIRLQAMTKDNNGNPDEADNKALENHWAIWSKKGNCEVTGQYSFKDICSMVMRTTPRDGEILIRKVRNFNNPYRYALQLIEADHLDINFNDTTRNGNIVKMGIEFNSWGKPVAYHLFKQHPGEYLMAGSGYNYGERVRIPADQIIHFHLKNRLSANRGVPWMHAAMTTLNMIGGYMEAEITAARMGAAKMGFLKSSTGGTYNGDSTDTTTGYKINEVSPGEIEEIGNMDFVGFDPQHPTAAFEAFMKVLLRAVASAAEIGYTSLANDLENANFSSLKMGEDDPRDFYRFMQQQLIEHLIVPVYEDWLKWAIVSGSLVNEFGVALPMSRYEKYLNVRWMPRGFRSIDAKEMLYDVMAVNAGLDSEMNIVAQRSGMDYEDIIADKAKAEAIRKKYGIKTDFDLKQLVESVKESDENN